MTAVDRDTLEAVRTLWLSVPALPALLDRPPAAGQLKSPREQPLPLPYARISCEDARKAVHYPKGVRKDVRKVTLEVWGTEAHCRAAIEAATDVFNSRMGATGRPKLTFPSGAILIKWWPLSTGTVARENDVQREGQDVWRATIEAEVYSSRSESP